MRQQSPCVRMRGLRPQSGTWKSGMRRVQGWVRWAGAFALPLLMGACAGVPRDVALPVDDPHEQSNRRFMALNQATLGPASEVVNTVVPGPVHDRVRDFNSNLKEPRIFVNNMLQGRFEAASQTGGRFLINSL